MQTVAPSLATSPQILYQRPYDQMIVPVQSPTVALAANPQPLVALSQPSYAPARLATTTVAGGGAGANNAGPSMFRHALLRVSSPSNPFLHLRFSLRDRRRSRRCSRSRDQCRRCRTHGYRSQSSTCSRNSEVSHIVELLFRSNRCLASNRRHRCRSFR